MIRFNGKAWNAKTIAFIILYKWKRGNIVYSGMIRLLKLAMKRKMEF